MKTLIEKSIKVTGIGFADIKTIFTIEKKSEKESLLYKSLLTIIGRKLVVLFDYTEDGIKKSDRVQLTIPEAKTEEEVKDFIVFEINKTLN